MRVLNNIPAMNTARMLGINNNTKSRSTERMSSGYRINRAADDASGLAISEKMRGQIRGLIRGSHNVHEGINMINVAEGGMQEQTAILQRIRELTVQSYNDTNTNEDRIAIQYEVDALLEEIDRISEQTEYNTIPVLQGPKKTTSTMQIEPSTPYREVYRTTTTQNVFPDWANGDSKLKTNNSNIDSNLVQDIDKELTLFDYNTGSNNAVAYGRKPSSSQIYYLDTDGNPTKDETLAAGYPDHHIYFDYASGSHVERVEYKGTWTPELSDNSSTTINFSKIADSTDKTSLMNTLSELIGTGIGFQCKTCGEHGAYQGFSFSTSDVYVTPEYDKNDFSLVPGNFNNIMLDSAVSKINSLIDEDDFSNMTDDEKDAAGIHPLDIPYSSYVNNTAKTIAADITNSVYDSSKRWSHFIRSYKESDYQVDFFDFRDQNIPADGTNGNIKKDFVMNTRIKELEANIPVNITVTEEHDYWIQIAANSEEGTFIDFPNTSVKGLDMKDYSVFPNGYCSTTPDGSYDPEMVKDAEYLGQGRYRKNFGGQVVTTTRHVEYDKPYTTGETQLIVDDNGEARQKWVITGSGSNHISYDIEEKSIIGGTWIEFTAIPPDGWGYDSLTRVDRALNNLSSRRSYLGAATNRLEHAYLNDDNIAENLQASESKIRDANMADESLQLAMSTILEQAGMSMLSQANQSPNGILQLLQ